MAVAALSQFAVLASAARTASVNSADFTNTAGARGLRVWIKCTVDPAAASVVFTIQGKSAQGDYYDILESPAVASVTTATLVVHPEIAASANAIANTNLPYQWRVEAVAADADSITYSVGAEYLY